MIDPGPTSVSVVIATHRRPELLDRCLRGVTRSAGRIERVAVVHSGDAATVDVARRWSDSLPMLEFAGRQQGVSARRNQGWRACDSRVIAFTDDDCEPTEGWITAIAGATSAGAEVVQGKVLPHPEDAANLGGAFTRTLHVAAASDLYAGANLSVSRAMLESVGGFDEAMTGGEDTDLAWRVIEAGGVVAWAPDAVVLHAIRAVRFREQLQSLNRWSSLPVVLRRHPQLRNELTARIFWKPPHVAAAAAWLGIAAGMIDRRALLLVAAPFAQRIRANGCYDGAELAISDLAEVAILAAASARHGSLLL